ncbi:glucose-6-phosphate dehydrogenase [Domibacillus antri]|uniref:Glucose-6-phosphate 1-dehydrogenase n=1 Tax=Domibacillus antri TaxID=1714264 RepID=A0A1Q8Q3A0_9BACI|nr:glucose-6-phosphate dehydrogenase [Domibacillus antri]OLN21807.1 glucose-6-phosphate dehydrogenase [Domibacillus antri]
MTFVLFGATGDLAKRKIFPALYNLFMDGKMPDSFSIVGVGRREWSDQTFQSHVEESVHTFSRRIINDASNMKTFLQAFRYSPLDVTKSDEYQSLLETVQQQEKNLSIPENRLFYLSVSPEFVDAITSNIKQSGLGTVKGWKRLIVEKPFGHDLTSARELNEKLSRTFEEEEMYRIDHYLGKPMVQNLESLVYTNPLLRAIWNKDHIVNVQITASEVVGVEERAGYYDRAGAIRDMVQNHMLQMVMMTAMQISKKGAEEVNDEKRKVMESLRPLQKEDVAANVIRGQYGPGEIKGEPVTAYENEPGVSPSSKNDTFIAARLWIDNDFWAGVPFYIRTGKRMQEKSTRIVVEFKNPLSAETAPNRLTIDISPSEGVSLQLNMKNPLNNQIEPVSIDFSANAKDVPEAYELLLFGALRGDPTFFAHWKEVELSWEWVQPILDAFEEDLVPLHLYRSGSMGPEASYQLLQEDGFKWLDHEQK